MVTRAGKVHGLTKSLREFRTERVEQFTHTNVDLFSLAKLASEVGMGFGFSAPVIVLLLGHGEAFFVLRHGLLGVELYELLRVGLR